MAVETAVTRKADEKRNRAVTREPAVRRVIKPYLPETNRKGASRFIEWLIDKDDAPPLGVRRVITQVFQDLIGTKDIQDAATATHSWMAGAVGHATLGAAPVLVLCWHFATEPTDYVVFGLIVFGIFFLKELWDYKSASARKGGIFTFRGDEVAWNVFTAVFYFSLGALWVVSLFAGWWPGEGWWPIAAFLVLSVIALRIAYWWLRRKLAFQQAGLPYQYRLATFTGRLHADDQVSADLAEKIRCLANVPQKPTSLFKFLFCPDRPHCEQAATRHLIICGTLKSGKTSLGVGIGTEFAFSLHLSRYLSAVKLVQSLDEKPDQHWQTNITEMEMEFEGGRNLWPLKACDLLIIDDVAEKPAIAPNVQAGAGRAPVAGQRITLMEPDELQPAVRGRLAWLGQRRSVWIVGDPERVAEWRRHVSAIIGVGVDQIMTVQLQGRPPPSAGKRVFDRLRRWWASGRKQTGFQDSGNGASR